MDFRHVHEFSLHKVVFSVTTGKHEAEVSINLSAMDHKNAKTKDLVVNCCAEYCLLVG